MSKIKVIACDIYGTVLCEDDPENIMPPRRGFIEFIKRVKKYDIRLVSTSDANSTNLVIDLNDTFEGRAPLDSGIFDRHYHLAMIPKDYSALLINFAIRPEELLIIGNNEYKDLSGAPALAIKKLVPTYKGITDEFDFNSIILS